MKEKLVNPRETISRVKPGIGLQAWFKRTGDLVYINSPCVLTEAKILKIGEVYVIHDFTEPDVKTTYIKLLWVYLRGFSFHIIAVDISNGDLKLKSQRLNAKVLPCSFLICDLAYFKESLEDKIIKNLVDSDQLDFNYLGDEL